MSRRLIGRVLMEAMGYSSWKDADLLSSMIVSMYCPQRVVRLASLLWNIGGVISVKVEYRTTTAHVVYDTDTMRSGGTFDGAIFTEPCSFKDFSIGNGEVKE